MAAWALRRSAPLRDSGWNTPPRLGCGTRSCDRARHFNARSLVYSVRNGWRRGASLCWNAALAAGFRANPLRATEYPSRSIPLILRSGNKLSGFSENCHRKRTPTTYRDWMVEWRIRRGPTTDEQVPISTFTRATARARKNGSSAAFDFPDSYSEPALLMTTLLRARDGFRHDHGSRHDRGLPRKSRICRNILSASRLRHIFRRIRARFICSSGASLRRSTRRLPARREKSSICRSISQTSDSRTPSRIRSIASTASSARRISNSSSCFSGISRASTACATRCSASSRRASLRRSDAGEDRRARESARPCRRRIRSRGGKSSSAARTITAESFSRRLAPRRPTAEASAEFLDHIREGRCSARKATGGTPLALSHGLYNTLSCFIQRPVSREARTERAAARKGVLALHGRARPDGVHAGRESTVSSRKACVAERSSSWRSRRTCRSGNSSPATSPQPEVKAHAGRRRSAGSPSRSGGLSHRELRRGTARVPLFHEVRASSSAAGISSKASRRLSGIAPILVIAGALHLRLPQPGAVARVAARDLSAN